MIRKVKVLFVTYSTDVRGGANKSLLDIVAYLMKAKIEPIFLIRGEGDLSIALKDMGIPYYIIQWNPWVYSAGVSKKDLFVRSLSNLYNFVKALPIIFSFRKHVDVVHTNTLITSLGIYVSFFLNKKHIWHIREFVKEDYRLEFVWPECFVKYIVSKSALIVANSEATKKKFSSLFSKSVLAIYNGFDPRKYIVLGRKSEYSVVRFLMCATMVSGKNHMECLRACNYLVHQKNIFNFRLYIAGDGDSKLRQELKEYVETNGLHQYIIFLGHVYDVKSLRSVTHVSIVPSVAEAFGRVSVEAMFARQPVIASDSGANRELVRDGYNGVLYTLGSYRSLAGAMLNFISNPNCINEYGDNGFNYAMRKFHIEHISKKVLDCYLRCW